MKTICLILATSSLSFAASPNEPALPDVPYSVADSMWPLELGGHRAKVTVDKPSSAVLARLPWRLQLQDMEKHQILVINAATGKPVANVVRASASRMSGEIVFEAATAGTYFIHYLPVFPYRNMNDPSGHVPYSCSTDAAWRQTHGVSEELLPTGGWKALPQARVLEFQARTESDRFDPMEVIASVEETKDLTAKHAGQLLVFPEDRSRPIRMRDDLPLRWIRSGPGDAFSGTAMRNEYYAFQLGLFAPAKAARNISLKFSDLQAPGGSMIPASALTCFNLGGIDSRGEAFVRAVDVPAGRIQSLWLGVDVAKDQPQGEYSGTIEVAAEGVPAQRVSVRIKILPDVIAERGDNEPWRHSRLRWLNSRAGAGGTIPEPYQALATKGSAISCVGRTLTIGDSGLPAAITAGTSPVLAAPVRFVVESASGPLALTPGKTGWSAKTPARVSWQSESTGAAATLACAGEMEYDGHVRYQLTLTPKAPLDLKDIRLELPMNPGAARFILGAGHPGGLRPGNFRWNWQGPFNSFWLGSTDAGLHCKLLGGAYTGPMLNLYHPAPPVAWANGGKGGVAVSEQENAVTATAYSGPRRIAAGESVTFEFSLLITPVKPLDTTEHFKTRYYHSGDNWRKDGRGNDPEPPEGDLARGVNVVNLHHASIYNPYINYPFLRTRELGEFTQRMHERKVKVKVYNTVRELTSMTTELWALRSLGDEVIASGAGGGYSWCREHMVTGYTPAWFQRFGDSPPDAAFVTSGNLRSRWQNYYVEGIGWLVRNTGIDGLYLDDVSYGRDILQRVRTVMAEAKPGCMIDLHSNTGFSIGCTNHYMEFMPYVDRPWFGESFNYDAMTPDEYLIQVSGIPFGVMGEMLHHGGNPWRGALYGMTNRLGWTTDGVKCDPRPVWKIWDRFGIVDAEMIGYWQPDCPVKTHHPQVPATVYRKPGSALIAIASWAAESTEVRLDIDWKRLGLNPATVKLFAPASAGFQKPGQWRPGDPITVAPRKGLLILADESGPTRSDLDAVERLGRKVLLDESFAGPLSGKWKITTSGHPGTSLAPGEGGGLVVRAAANVSACAERHLPPGVTAAECRIDNQGDRGETWGTGMSLFWPGGQALRVNLRTPEGAFGLDSTGGQQRIRLGHIGDGPVTLRIRIEPHEVIAEAHNANDGWQPLGSYPRVDFPGDPERIVIGKSRGVLDTTDHTTPGASGGAVIRQVVIYGR